MSDLDTRLRETLNTVADRTKVHSRFDEIAQRRQRRALPRPAVPVVAFAAVVALFTVPMLFSNPPENNVGGDGGLAPAEVEVIIDPSWLTVEPSEITAYNDLPLPGEGERASLRSETIWCFYEDARPVETHIAGVAVDEPVTIDALTQTCATETDVASETEATQDTMTVCRGVVDPSAYEEWASTGETTIITGDVSTAKPGFPVVLGWQSDCISESVASNPAITLTADLSLEAINKARELDLAVVTAANENCLTYDQSEALTEAVIEELEAGFMHIAWTRPNESTDRCFQPFIDQQWGWVISDIIRDNSPASTTASTIPPTNP